MYRILITFSVQFKFGYIEIYEQYLQMRIKNSGRMDIIRIDLLFSNNTHFLHWEKNAIESKAFLSKSIYTINL